MDPLERKSLFILMSFQVNRRDFCLVSVERLEQDRSILSLIPVTIKAVSLGLTFYWILEYAFPTLETYFVCFHSRFEKGGTV